MKKLFTIFLVAVCIIGIYHVADARSGCCSYHQGVCSCGVSGNRCCDGSSLSAKCAPYYPACIDRKTPPTPPQPSCSDIKAGTCNGKVYTKCQQKAYDSCVKEEQFWTEHKKNIKNAVREYLCRSVTQADLDFYGNYSHDMSKIVDLMKDSEEYQECQTKSGVNRTSDNIKVQAVNTSKTFDNNIKGQVTKPDDSQAEYSNIEYAAIIIIGAIVVVCLVYRNKNKLIDK